jgi:subtilisin family serine protease
MSLLLAVACMGLLASCGGGVGGDSAPVIASSTAPRQFSSADVMTGEVSGRVFLRGELDIVVNDNVSFEKLCQQKGWTILRKLGDIGAYTVKTDAATEEILKQYVSELKKLSYVEVAGLNFVHTIPQALSQDPSWQVLEDSWNMTAIYLPRARELLSNLGADISIGVIDGAFNANHEDVNIHSIEVVPGKSNSFDSPDYNSAVRGSFDGDNPSNHGMHVFGIIGAKENNSIGLVGVAPNSVIDGYDPYTNETSADDGSIYAGIEFFKNKQIINISSGSGACVKTCAFTRSDLNGISNDSAVRALTKIYKTLVASTNPQGTLIVQSSGNSGSVKTVDGISIYAEDNGFLASALGATFSDPVQKAMQNYVAEHALIVGAYSMDSSSSKKITSYTQIPGPNSYKALSDSFLLAPGGDENYAVYSTLLPNSKGISQYGLMAGTSMAAPHVTGVAALVLQANSSLTVSQVRRIILDNSDVVNGYPALNAEKAVRAALDTLTKPTVTLTATTTTPQLSQSVSFTANASSPNGTIKTYSWSFGDGTTLTGQTSPTTSHAFGATGDYAVTVTVMDEKGAQNTSTAVHIQPVSPIPNPTVTSITAPSTLTAGVNATFSINGTNLPTTGNLVITPSGVGCTGFGYGTRSATAHTFACTPSSAGSLNFSVSIASGQSLGAFPSTPFTVSGTAPAVLQLTDSFGGTSLDGTKWNAISGAGGIQYSGTEVTFGGGSYATTQNKVTFSGSKIVVEGRFTGVPGSMQDTHMDLIDATTGEYIQFGDTSNAGYGFYLYGAGASFNGVDATTRVILALGGSIQTYMDYRLTLDEATAKIERSNSFSDATQIVTTRTVPLPQTIVGRTFYLRIGTGALVGGYSPGVFDSVSVSVTP